jgi:hypothetical protein
MGEPIAASETACSRSGDGCRAMGSRSLRLLGGLAALIGLLPASIAQPSPNNQITARYLGAFDNAAAARSPGAGGSSLSSPQIGSLGGARPDLEQANPPASTASFNPAAVGLSAGSAQTLNLAFSVSGYGGSFTPTAVLHYGLSYTVGTLACTATDGSENCTVPVSFQPLYPGGRRDALFLMDGATRLATVLLYGVGQSPLALVQPASLVNTYGNNNSYFYQSVTDENGTVWSISSNVNTLTSLTTAGIFTNIPYTGLYTSGLATIAMDGAGVIYISYANGSNSFVTYDTVQGISGTFQLPGTERFEIVGVGNTGNVYAVDTNYENYYQVLGTIAPSGAVTLTPLALSSTGQPDSPEGIAVDSEENLFFGGYSTMNEYSNTFVQTTINTHNDKAGIAVDAADSLYAAAYGESSFVQLAPSNYTTPSYQFSGGEYGVSLGPDGTINAGEYFNLVQYIRSQGAISFATNYGDATPPAQDTGIYNGGNQPLTISNIALTGSPVFSVQAVAGNGCTDGMVLAPGTACEVAITFTAPHPGSFTGALAFTTNSLNTVDSTQTVALSATARGVYAVASPASLTFPDQIVSTTSAAQMVTVTNEGYPNDLGVSVPNLAAGGIFSAGVGTCGPQLAVGASCQFPVTFSPLSIQSYNGSFTLVIASNLILPVSGTGIAAPTPLQINEVIHVSDGTPAVVPATPLRINEVLHISDGTPATVPATPLLINEVIHVSDGTSALVPATPLQINEVLHISDGTPATVPATPLLISEVLHISDGAPAVVPATPLLINEVLHISDGTPAVVPATPLQLSEVIHISDGIPAAVPATPLQINEVIHVSDGTSALVPATPLQINEVIHISDGTPAVVPATPLLINEVLHISDGTPAVVPATPLLINEVLHISDTPGPISPVVVAAVVETIHVTDTPTVGLPVVAAVVETIHVTDTPTVGLPVVAAVVETIHVTDTPTVGLPVVAAVVETIHVIDTPAVGLPVVAAVVETIHVTDTPAVGLPVVAAVVETIHVTDTPAAGLPVIAAVVETIHVTDTPAVGLPVVAAVVETIHVTDTPTIGLPVVAAVVETIHVTDTSTVGLPVVAAVVETIHVTDTLTVGLPVVAAVVETIHVTDTPTVGLPVVAAVVETIHVTDTPTVGLPVVAAVVETIHVTDTPTVGLPVVAAVVETIHVTDTPTIGLPVVAAVVETIHVTDTPTIGLPVVAAVVETIHVTDTPVATLTSPTTTHLNSSTAMMAAGNPVTFTATVSSAGGTPTGNVTFYDGTSALSTVSLSNGTATYTTSSLTDGAHSISAVYSGNASFLTSTSNTVAETITDFTLSVASSGGSGVTLTILPGASGTYTITLTPPSSGFTGVITLSARGLPAGATAIFSPNPITLGSTPVSSTLTITIPAAHTQIQPQWPINSKTFLLLGVLLPLLGLRRARKLGLRRLLTVALLSICIMGISSCGGVFFTQPSQSYTITITATSGTDQHSATINLIVP